MAKQRFIRIEEEMVPVSEEVYLAWYRSVWREHNFARNHGKCGQSDWKKCYGDCGLCGFQMAGDCLSSDAWSDEYGLELKTKTPDPEDIAISNIWLEEQLSHLEKEVSDGRRIAELLMNGATIREGALELQISRSTFADKKKRIQKCLRKSEDISKNP